MTQVRTDPPRPSLVELETALLATTGVAVEQRDVEVSGLSLHTLQAGDGEPLLLLHGRGNAGAMFAPILARLAEHRRALTLDLPGWGLSAKPEFTGRTAQDAVSWWAGAVIAYLDSQGIEAVDLLGHSLGGLTALVVALEHPERVRRLILVDSAGLGTQVQWDVRLYFSIVPERLHARLGPAFTRSILKRNHAPPEDLTGPRFDFTHAIMSQLDVLPSGARAFSRYFNLSGVHLTLADRVKELGMPVLLLWGAQDFVTRYDDALVAARHLRDGQLVTLNNAGHSPFAERPEDFAGVVLTWLDGIHVRSRI
jgi:pimeloyl-ACP methyl ester carboxylesterase